MLGCFQGLGLMRSLEKALNSQGWVDKAFEKAWNTIHGKFCKLIGTWAPMQISPVWGTVIYAKSRFMTYTELASVQGHGKAQVSPR